MQDKEQNNAADSSPNTDALHISDKQLSLFLEDTQTTLGKSPDTFNRQAGAAMVEKWEAILESSGKAGLAKIIFELKKLRGYLQEEKPDGHLIAASMATLGDETKKVAESTVSGFKAPLAEFGNLLIKVASSLSK